MAGIGGATIAEAKERLGTREVARWVKYIEQRGTLNIGLRLEAGFALLAYWLTKVGKYSKEGGGDFTPQDFVTHFDKDTGSDGELTIAQVMRAFGKK